MAQKSGSHIYKQAHIVHTYIIICIHTYNHTCISSDNKPVKWKTDKVLSRNPFCKWCQHRKLKLVLLSRRADCIARCPCAVFSAWSWQPFQTKTERSLLHSGCYRRKSSTSVKYFVGLRTSRANHASVFCMLPCLQNFSTRYKISYQTDAVYAIYFIIIYCKIKHN